jgi:hypothetical protein
VDGATYHVSRALYRRIVPEIAGAPRGDPDTFQLRVHDACERTMLRIESEPHFAHPDRYLFGEIRAYFPVSEQAWLRKLIEFHVDVARELAERLRLEQQRTCPALTRQGTPCQREPLPEKEFCPSHRHLEVFEEAEPSQPLDA